MISEGEARKKVLEKIEVRPSRSVLLSQALSCFAAEDYFSSLPLPNFDNSAMDGYAVVASSCGLGKRLRVIGEQPAALDRQLRVSAGEAVRIFTGAPMPAGADAVVMQEDVTREGSEIVVNVDVEPDEFVRRRGCDLAKGQKIVAKGELIRPATIALLASQGVTQVSVGGEVDAAIISTGDELVRVGEEIKPGQIYESNSVLLQALLRRCDAAVKSMRHCKDDAESLRKTLEEAIKYSVLIISGGVSVGEHDLVQPTLRSIGAKIDIWRVVIKPGKPFLVRGRFEHGAFAPVGRQESHALFGLSKSNALLRLGVGEAQRGGESVEIHPFD